MDLSKLPKLSDSSQAPQPPPQVPEQAAPESHPVGYGGYQRPPASIGADIWFNVIVAIILLFLGRSFFSWSVAKMTGQTFHTNVTWTEGANAGNEVAYFDLQGLTAWTDTGMFLFGLAVLFPKRSSSPSRFSNPPVPRGSRLFRTLAHRPLHDHQPLCQHQAHEHRNPPTHVGTRGGFWGIHDRLHSRSAPNPIASASTNRPNGEYLLVS